MSDGRLDQETLGVVRAGVAVRRRAGRWTIGASLDLDLLLNTPPPYTREGSSAQVFAVPSFAFAVGLIAAADFGGIGP